MCLKKLALFLLTLYLFNLLNRMNKYGRSKLVKLFLHNFKRAVLLDSTFFRLAYRHGADIAILFQSGRYELRELGME